MRQGAPAARQGLQFRSGSTAGCPAALLRVSAPRPPPVGAGAAKVKAADLENQGRAPTSTNALGWYNRERYSVFRIDNQDQVTSSCLTILTPSRNNRTLRSLKRPPCSRDKKSTGSSPSKQPSKQTPWQCKHQDQQRQTPPSVTRPTPQTKPRQPHPAA